MYVYTNGDVFFFPSWYNSKNIFINFTFCFLFFVNNVSPLQNCIIISCFVEIKYLHCLKLRIGKKLLKFLSIYLFLLCKYLIIYGYFHLYFWKILKFRSLKFPERLVKNYLSYWQFLFTRCTVKDYYKIRFNVYSKYFFVNLFL